MIIPSLPASWAIWQIFGHMCVHPSRDVALPSFMQNMSVSSSLRQPIELESFFVRSFQRKASSGVRVQIMNVEDVD